MNEAVNGALLVIVVVSAVIGTATLKSKHLLRVFAKKMRARAAAMEASEYAWKRAWNDSVSADEQFDAERAELERMASK